VVFEVELSFVDLVNNRFWKGIRTSCKDLKNRCYHRVGICFDHWL